MFVILAAVGIAAGFVLLLRLIAGPDGDESTLVRLFATAPMPARPRGTQEIDLAPFAFPDPPAAAASGGSVHAFEGRMDSARAA